MPLKGVISRLLGLGSSGVYGDEAPNRQGSEFEVNNWVISDFVLRKLVPIVGLKPFPLNEQMLMVAAVLRLRPTHIFEWGTNIGKSARIFHEVCTEFGIDAEIHTIDLPDDMEHAEHPKEKRGYLVRGRAGVQLHQGDGLDTALQVLSQCGTTAVTPLFFIDGDHSYDSVKRELGEVIDKVPAANVLLHDTFYQSGTSGYNVGPYRAIEDVLGERSHSFRIVAQNMGLPGMTLLWLSGSKEA